MGKVVSSLQREATEIGGSLIGAGPVFYCCGGAVDMDTADKGRVEWKRGSTKREEVDRGWTCKVEGMDKVLYRTAFGHFIKDSGPAAFQTIFVVFFTACVLLHLRN